MKIIGREEARAAGLNKYFTGVPCKHGHLAERRVSYTMCIECDRLRQLRPELREKVGAWRAANRDSIKKRHKEYVAENVEYFKELRTAYRKANKKDFHRRQAKYRKAHPDRIKVARRALKASASGKHTAADIHEIRKLQGNRCAYCRVSLSKAKPNVDHIKPLARGGSNDRKNLQLLCQSCNNRKHAKDPIDFARQQGFLL